VAWQARQGVAWRGTAWQARRGVARRGEAGHGLAGMAGHGKAGLGMAGKARPTLRGVIMAEHLTSQAAARIAARLARNSQFAAMKATNQLLDLAQQDVRAGIRARFHVTQDRFINNLVKRRKDDFATKTNLVGRLRIEGPGQDDFKRRAASVLTRHEVGGVSLPKTAGDPILAGRFALRTDVLRVSPRDRKYSLPNLGLVPIRDPNGQTFYAGGKRSRSRKVGPLRTTARGVIQIKGKRRVFALDPRYHIGVSRLLIYERTGPHKTDLQLLYFGTPRYKITPRLQFLQTARATITRRRADVYAAALRAALK
jgi:hypothetical protein